MTHPDPPSLTLARAIWHLLEDSGATMADKTAAVDIARTLTSAEYSETVLGSRKRARDVNPS